jgi:hypothetical protein
MTYLGVARGSFEVALKAFHEHNRVPSVKSPLHHGLYSFMSVYVGQTGVKASISIRSEIHGLPVHDIISLSGCVAKIVSPSLVVILATSIIMMACLMSCLVSFLRGEVFRPASLKILQLLSSVF